jgi:hypothetical protein
MKKIDKQELEKLQTLQSAYSSLIFKFGELYVSKLLHDNKEKQLLGELESIKAEENKTKSELVEKYGDNLNINIESGEY